MNPKEALRLKQMLFYESNAYSLGYRLPAGLDEAGRGPLAGPVVACACILPQDTLFEGVNDSKKLSKKKREQLFSELTANPAVLYGIGVVESTEIDRLNIHQATFLAMRQAIEKLGKPPDYLLVDGFSLPGVTIPCLKLIKGDQLSLSIATASILAKVTRDRIMEKCHERWPVYGFDTHMGYGTKKHLNALQEYGPCEVHRFSFAPIKDTCL